MRRGLDQAVFCKMAEVRFIIPLDQVKQKKWPHSCGISTENEAWVFCTVVESLKKSLVTSWHQLHPSAHASTFPWGYSDEGKSFIRNISQAQTFNSAPFPSFPRPRSQTLGLFFFFFNNPTLTALLTLPAHCQWDFMDSDGCIMNMDAIEIQSCCCLEALCASLNVRLHDLQRRDQGTLTFFFPGSMLYGKTMVHFMWNRSGNAQERRKRDSWHFKMVKIYISCKFYFDH